LDRLGKYEILGEIGAGGMAVVYKARDSLLERTIALKVINQRLQPDESAYKRFLNEAKVAAALTHPNIVVIHELGIDEGRPFIAMEYLPGRDLRELIERGVPLELRQKIDIALQVALALDHAHGRGVIHRDVKPANIRLLDSGFVKLMDFGIAKITTEELTRLTRTGTVIGTACYMSPEQVRNETLTPASDVFSFGCVLYELLSYHKAYDASDTLAVLYQILYAEPPQLPPGQDPIEAECCRLVEGCLKRSVAERFPSFAPVLDTLSALQRQLSSRGPGRVSTGPVQAVLAERTAGSAPLPATTTEPVAPLQLRQTQETASTRPAQRRRPWLRRPALFLGAASALALALALLPLLGPRGQVDPTPTPTPAGRQTASDAPVPAIVQQPAPSATAPDPTPVDLPGASGPPSDTPTPAGPPSDTPTPPLQATPPQPPVAAVPPPSATPRPPTARPTWTPDLPPPPPTSTPRPPTSTPRPEPSPTRTIRPDIGLLDLSVEPWGFVQIDGAGPELRTPAEPLELRPGRHSLRVYRDGFETVERTVFIRPGRTLELRIRLRAQEFGTARFVLEGAPWAFFRIDEGQEMQLPHPPIQLTRGLHSVIVYRPGYRKEIRRFRIRSFEETEIRIELRKTKEND
jgi:serine/threonine-protein kinase